MGLDMYLYRRTYVQNWDHYKEEHKHKITVEKGGKLRTDIKPERISHIIEQVAYWRKANAIHKWFVQNVQDGKDECQESHVPREKLQALLSLCKQVLETVETIEGEVNTGTTYYPNGEVIQHTKPGPVVAQKQLAASMLPTQSGFFFGSTDYDEYYIQDIRETVEMIAPLLDDGNDGEFYYNASW